MGFGGRKSAKKVLVEALEGPMPHFNHKQYSFNVNQSGIGHDRERWVLCGIRADIADEPADPLMLGFEDIHDLLNIKLPCLADDDLTTNEWTNFYDYQTFLRQEYEEGNIVGKVAVFDATRKLRGKWDCAMRTDGTIGALTTHDVKKVVMSTYDMDKDMKDRSFCRIVHSGERFMLQGHHASTRNFYKLQAPHHTRY